MCTSTMNGCLLCKVCVVKVNILELDVWRTTKQHHLHHVQQLFSWFITVTHDKDLQSSISQNQPHNQPHYTNHEINHAISHFLLMPKINHTISHVILTHEINHTISHIQLTHEINHAISHVILTSEVFLYNFLQCHWLLLPTGLPNADQHVSESWMSTENCL